MARTFGENLSNLIPDAAKEIRGLFKPKGRESGTPVESGKTAAEQRAAMVAADRAKSDARIAEIRAEMDALFNAPSPSEVGARVVSAPDRSYQPVSLERAKLLDEKRRIEQSFRATKDAQRRKEMEARLVRVDEELRAA